MAAQGCATFPSFCAWDQSFMQGNVRNVTNPAPEICYDLNGPRRSFVNDTGYTAVVFEDSTCGLLSVSAVIIPRGYMNEILPIQSVLFLPV
ncbi:peptidase inhibitor family I36 protein [Saccharothrix sp. Mg75]|uniref:peptidase inhibitor family I36 protein n=1 Tax=Saccharothrix sp. Mg75 TaxID=3445357 RepID=UPI003EEEA578